MPGQSVLVIESEAVVAAAVWESLPVERRLEVTVRLARLLARLIEAARAGGRGRRGSGALGASTEGREIVR